MRSLRRTWNDLYSVGPVSVVGGPGGVGGTSCGAHETVFSAGSARVASTHPAVAQPSRAALRARPGPSSPPRDLGRACV